MGCQTEITRTIVDGEGHYVLAAKGNQPALYNGTGDYSANHLEDDSARVQVRRYQTHERGHGRDETRNFFLCRVPADLPDKCLGPFTGTRGQYRLAV